jgi:hypothetical protein
MPSASILELSSDQQVDNPGTSAATINIDWDTETKYLDGAYDFHEAVTNPDRLTIPAAMNGQPYEVFLWVEDTTAVWDASAGMYIGIQSSGIPDWTAWWGIYADQGKAARGCRTGPLVADDQEGYFYVPIREFGSNSMFARATKCRFGILEGNPAPVGWGICRDQSPNYSIPNGTSILAPANEHNFGNVYRGGTYTAPPGATLAVADVTVVITSETNSADVTHTLLVNGSSFAEFMHSGSLRGYGPVTYGLFPVSPGDEIEFQIAHSTGFDRSGRVAHSVQFF